MPSVEGTVDDFLKLYGKLPAPLQEKLFVKLFRGSATILDEWFIFDVSDEEFDKVIEVNAKVVETSQPSGYVVLLKSDTRRGVVHEIRVRKKGEAVTPISCSCEDFRIRRNPKCKHMRQVELSFA